MMGQPPFTGPTTFSSGTRTSSKKSSLNSERPLSWTSGRQVMPGVRMSTTRQLMPSCLRASGSLRTRRRHQSAKCALLDHTFCPLTTQWSPSRRARQRSEARSEPAFGSEKPRHQTWSAGRMGGSQRACCAGVPKRMRVGPTMLTLTGSRISGARARAISSVKMICSRRLAPRPPCARGHWMPTQPPAARARCQARWKRRRSPSSSGAGARGRLASSQARSSARKASSAGV